MISRILLTLAVVASVVAECMAAAGHPRFLDNYNISCLTMRDGMANNNVDDIYRDSKGFLWISYLGGGLSRFDGYNFVNFSDAAGDHRIRSCFVSMVTEDAHGRLWVAGDCGIDVINLRTLTVEAPRDLTGRFDDISAMSATDVVADTQGNIWLGTKQAVVFLGLGDNGDITATASMPVAVTYHRGVTMRDIDGDGRVWTGVADSVLKLTPAADGSIVSAPVSQRLSALPGVDYFSDFVKNDGQVWVSTSNGLFRYDPHTDQVKHYLSVLPDEKTLSQNFLTDIAVTAGGRLLVSSLRGFNVYNPLNDTFERTFDSPANINNQFINMMLADDDKIFIGTEGGGVNVLSPRRININSYIHSDSDPGSLSANPVNAIAEGPDGTLWVGTVEGGLNARPRGQRSFSHITTDGGRLPHNSVSALAFDGNNRLWVGTWGGGIAVLDPEPPYRPARHINPWNGYGRDIAFVGSLVRDAVNDGMFIGANNGISYYDNTSGTLQAAITPGPDFEAFGFIGGFVDSRNRLWMGSALGYIVIDLMNRNADGTFAFERYKNPTDTARSAATFRPTCFYESSDSTMWIGTNGQGLCSAVTACDGTISYRCYTTADGLANNAVRGIAAAQGGNLWVATINGLSLFDPERKHFTNFTSNDGLPDNQFYWNATCPTSDGSIMFGTTCGIAEVLPSIDTSRDMPPVVLTGLYVDNTPVVGADGRITDRDIAYTDRITIHESDKSFTVEFAALDYEPQERGHYCYRLKGFDNDWITVNPNHRRASYTNLSPGEYTLQVMYQPSGTEPDAPVTELRVTVRPYFYKSPWFMAMVVFLVLVAGYYLSVRRVNDLKRQRQHLESEVEKRTAQLAEQKKLVEERAGELAERNCQLTRQNEEISSQKMQLTEMNRKVNKLTMDRIQFFTSITHEFRTPISLIIGPIGRALRLSTNPQVIEQLHFVERNSRYLLSLVNQLMDFRKVESGKMEISYASFNMRKFVDEVITPFLPVAAERGITVRSLCRLPQDDMAVFDEDSMRKVLINLVSNAIKYTPDNGRVTVYVALGTKLYIGVSDTGSGVADADKDHIFERFYQGGNNLKYPLPGAGDSGIGLYLCRTIVELHGGTISVKNNRRAGCTFRVIVPLPDADKVETAHATDGPDTRPRLISPVYDSDLQDRKTILVVEDNDDMRGFICSILRDRYSLIEARDGMEALKVLSEQTVDFIVSDLMMPRMDGLELSRRVKENFAISHIPFLMLTAKTATESRIDSYRIGVDDYLLKPFEESVLLARIEGIMHTRRMLQHRFSDSMDAGALDIVAESRDKKFIDQVMDTVRNNYRNSYFDVDDFAEALGISRSLLNKKLQSLMGQSAGQLVRNYRLNMAREIILRNRTTRALNISEIAYEVGFNDSKYFTRCFTKHFNITPSGMMNGGE